MSIRIYSNSVYSAYTCKELYTRMNAYIIIDEYVCFVPFDCNGKRVPFPFWVFCSILLLFSFSYSFSLVCSLFFYPSTFLSWKHAFCVTKRNMLYKSIKDTPILCIVQNHLCVHTGCFGPFGKLNNGKMAPHYYYTHTYEYRMSMCVSYYIRDIYEYMYWTYCTLLAHI